MTISAKLKKLNKQYQKRWRKGRGRKELDDPSLQDGETSEDRLDHDADRRLAALLESKSEEASNPYRWQLVCLFPLVLVLIPNSSEGVTGGLIVISFFAQVMGWIMVLRESYRSGTAVIVNSLTGNQIRKDLAILVLWHALPLSIVFSAAWGIHTGHLGSVLDPSPAYLILMVLLLASQLTAMAAAFVVGLLIAKVRQAA